MKDLITTRFLRGAQTTFLVLFLATSSSAQISSFPYFEDFESGPNGWMSEDQNFVDNWLLGSPNYSVIDHPAPGGTMSWYLDTADLFTSEYSYVISPEFDFSGLSYPWISLDIWWDLVTDMDGAVLQSSVDGGSSWQNVGHHDDNAAIASNWYNHAFLSIGFPNGGAGSQQVSHWSGDSLQGSQGWLTASHFLQGLAGESSVFIRFAWANRIGNGNRQADNVAFDNVHIYDGPEVDLEITDIQQAGPCGGGYEGQAYIFVSNLGGNSATISEIVDDQGNTYPLESPVEIAAFSSERILVSLPLQDPGMPTMNLGVNHAEDDNPDNNFMSFTFNCQVINGANHCNDFEDSSFAPWFIGAESINDSWGLSSHSNNITMNMPEENTGGSQFWATTNQNGTYNSDENSFVISPFFDFTNLTQIALTMLIWYDLETNWDGAVLQYSLDGGASWNNYGSQGSGTNWFNAGALSGPGAGGQNFAHWNGGGGVGSLTWILAEYTTLSAIAGQENVLFRLAVGSDNIFQDGGFAFDNFCVNGETGPDTPNVVINEFNYIDFDGNQLDFIELKNKGTDTVNITDLQLELWRHQNGSPLPTDILGSVQLGTGFIAPGDYFVIAADNGVPNADVVYDFVEDDNLYADTGSIELRYIPFGGTTLDEVGYGGNFGDHFEGTAITQVDPGDFLSSGLAFARILDGEDTDNNAADFSLQCATPGATNSAETFCLPGDTVDIAITNVEQLGPCGGGFAAPVRVTFENLGYFDQTINEVTDGTNTYTIIPAITLSQGEVASVVVNMLLIDPGTIGLTVSVDVPNDGNTANNSYVAQFNCIVQSALNHLNDFEDPDEAPWWIWHESENSSLNLGDNSSNVSINTPPPSGGTSSWTTTNGDGTYNPNERSAIISPYFDFSGMLNASVLFDLAQDAENGQDGAVLEYSENGGIDWISVGGLGTGLNWYDTGALPNGGAGDQNDAHWSGNGPAGTSGWNPATHLINFLDGLQNILFRFSFRSDSSAVVDGGFGVDNFYIFEAPETPDVVINEFNYVDYGGEKWDFVELLNRGADPVDMTEFRLNFIKMENGLTTTYESWAFPFVGGIIGPGQHFLIGDTSNFFAPAAQLHLFDSLGAVLGDTGAIELVYLPTNERVDVVCYGGNIPGYVETQAIQSVDPGTHLFREVGFSRNPNGFDSDNNQHDFFLRCITPGFTNNLTDSICYVPELVINEFNYSDPSGEAFDFVEIKNIGNEEVDLSNFEMNFYDDNATFTMPTLPLAGFLDAGDYYVIGAPNGVSNQDFTLVQASDYIVGPDGSLELVFIPDNSTADIVGFGNNFPGFDENGPILDFDDGEFVDYTKSFARFFDGFDTDDNHLDFILECHTPGTVNGSDTTCITVMVINEVDKIGANGDSVYVELFNKTPILGDLNGFILEFDDATNLDSIILDGTIGNQGYRVFSIPSSGFDSDHVTIMLQDTQSSTIVDRLTIAQTPIGLPNTENEFTTLDASQTLSISRIPNGEDTNDNGNDFALVCATLGSENFNDLSCDLVGIGEELKFEMRLYPNPAHDFIKLEAGKTGQFDIQILDGMGRIALIAFSSGQDRIDISALIPGVYSIIATDTNGKSAVGRFIKQ